MWSAWVGWWQISLNHACVCPTLPIGKWTIYEKLFDGRGKNLQFSPNSPHISDISAVKVGALQTQSENLNISKKPEIYYEKVQIVCANLCTFNPFSERVNGQLLHLKCHCRQFYTVMKCNLFTLNQHCLRGKVFLPSALMPVLLWYIVNDSFEIESALEYRFLSTKTRQWNIWKG